MKTAAILLLALAVPAALVLGRPAPPAGAGTLGLPPLSVPADNPMTRAKVELGRKLFMDRRLSPNNTMSCAMCHVPEQGFTVNEFATGLGMEGRSTRRNTPTLFNVGFVDALFHDGREASLERQVWGPLLMSNEMANPSVAYVVDKVRAMPDYAGSFERAFGGRGATRDTIAAAIASYERTLLAGDSRFDRWRYGGRADAVNARERAGFGLFSGKAKCIACHSAGPASALFSDGLFHNTGVGWTRAARLGSRVHRVQLAPGVFTTISDKELANVSEPVEPDLGRFEVTRAERELFAYRTPGLRNVALSAPYMHDGSLATLEQVVAFYNRGGIDNPNKDRLLRPLGLSAREQGELVAFLRSLTSSQAPALGRQARAGWVDRAGR
ncbi:cytochrome-c peroxidase [Massilia glaciei]|uniref:Methylamine utilization protein MauG n=1 Tax=Massilia glaciei TaxID=1524097 RepID=A0A2U2I786_9BURK|nr:cytochrome c peroxidase [Massilia glaciei]PWF55509.1 cytochrome C peroxidase [Massilia glaciei]